MGPDGSARLRIYLDSFEWLRKALSRLEIPKKKSSIYSFQRGGHIFFFRPPSLSRLCTTFSIGSFFFGIPRGSLGMWDPLGDTTWDPSESPNLGRGSLEIFGNLWI
jgi:hypothetical protein